MGSGGSFVWFAQENPGSSVVKLPFQDAVS